MQDFTKQNSSKFDYGKELTQEELNGLFIKTVKLDGYKWNQGTEHQMVLVVGSAFSEGCINKERLTTTGSYGGTFQMNWNYNKGNVYEITLPKTHNLQIATTGSSLMGAPETEKANHLVQLAVFYTKIGEAKIATDDGFSQVRKALGARAKELGVVAEAWDPIPLDAQLYAADPARAQAATELHAMLTQSLMPIIAGIKTQHSLGSLFNVGAPLHGYAVYRKEDNKDGKTNIKYSVRRKQN